MNASRSHLESCTLLSVSTMLCVPAGMLKPVAAYAVQEVLLAATLRTTAPSMASCTCGQVERHTVPRAASVSDVTTLAVVSEALATPFRSNSTARAPSALRSRKANAPRGSVMFSAFRLATGTGAADAVVAKSPAQVTTRATTAHPNFTTEPRRSPASNMRALRSQTSRTVHHRARQTTADTSYHTDPRANGWLLTVRGGGRHPCLSLAARPSRPGCEAGGGTSGRRPRRRRRPSCS